MNTRPALNAARALATTGVCPGWKWPRWKRMRTIGCASVGADDGSRGEQEDDLPQTARHLRPEAGQVAAGGEARERREQHGRDRDREHTLREHVDEERLLDRVRREVAVDQARGEERVDHRVDVDQPEAERDRNHHPEDAPDRGVMPVDQDPKPVVAAVEAAEPRHRQEHLDEGRRKDRRRVDVQLRAAGMRLRHADREPGDDREVPEDRRERRHREVVVAVQDPDDDSGDAEQRDDREQHPREPNRERTVVARIAEDSDHPRCDQDEQARSGRSARAASARRGSRRRARRGGALPSPADR